MAATKMQRDGFFEPMQPPAKCKFYLTLIARLVKNYVKLYYDQIMLDKHVDIQVSHNHPVNKFGHFWSSIGMILFAYPLIFWKCQPLKGCAWFFVTHVVRQSGHFFYEHQVSQMHPILDELFYAESTSLTRVLRVFSRIETLRSSSSDTRTPARRKLLLCFALLESRTNTAKKYASLPPTTSTLHSWNFHSSNTSVRLLSSRLFRILLRSCISTVGSGVCHGSLRSLR